MGRTHNQRTARIGILAPLCVLPALLLASVPSRAQAPVAVGGGLWGHQPSGTVQHQGTTLNEQQDLGFEPQAEGFAWLEIAPPVPLLPTLRLSYTDASTEGTSTLSHGVTFGGTGYPASATLASQANLEQYDAVLYYPLIDHAVDFDLGINLKYIDGSVQIRSQNGSSSAHISGAVPMIYVHGDIPLPLRGASIAADASFSAYGGNRLLDYTFKGIYELNLGLGAEAGWHTQELRLHNFQNVNMDTVWRGPYAGLFYRF